jgi:hypothetical protein
VRPMSAVALHVPEVTAYTAQSAVQLWIKANEGSGATSSPGSARRARCCLGISRTRARCRGGRPVGPTTATSPRCLSCSPRSAKWRCRDGWGGSGCGTSPTGSTHRSSRFPNEAQRLRDWRRLRALGIARAKSAAVPGEPTAVGEVGVPVTVEGTEGEWRADPDAPRPALHRPHGTAVAVRPPAPRP